MTVRNIASICNMVSGRRRRLGGRARSAERQRKGNRRRKRWAAGWGWGRGGRAGPPELPGPPGRRPQPLDAGGGARVLRPLGPGTGERARGCPGRAAVPPPSGCGGFSWGGGREAEPGRHGGAGWGTAAVAGTPSCPCGRESPAGRPGHRHPILSSLLKHYLKFTLQRQCIWKNLKGSKAVKKCKIVVREVNL